MCVPDSYDRMIVAMASGRIETSIERPGAMPMSRSDAPSRPVADPRSICPTPVPRPWMLHRWDEITFLHWRYEPEVVQRLLPPGLTVETFDGAAWVGLVPFVMEVRAPGVPRLPWLSVFPETNVRTYATGPSGETGVWFLTLDASRLPGVLTGRWGYQLPYMWSQMRVRHGVDHDGHATVRYTCSRRWPEPWPATSDVAVRIGSFFGPDELGDLDHWLTARWTLFSDHPGRRRRGRLDLARAEHPPWQLRKAEGVHLDDRLVTATGLPAPIGEPLVHHSAGTQVRISRPSHLSTSPIPVPRSR